MFYTNLTSTIENSLFKNIFSLLNSIFKIDTLVKKWLFIVGSFVFVVHLFR